MSKQDAIRKILGNEETGNRMTFGKHKGSDISNVPTNYLRWCIKENIIPAQAEEELERRKEL